jgi:plasmid stabilization system protein ParE
MTTIKFAPRAKRDLEDILLYLTEMAGEGTTQKYASEFADAIDLIQTMPAMGALRPLLGETTRAILVLPYVMFYDFDEEAQQVQILRILHGKQNITKSLLK